MTDAYYNDPRTDWNSGWMKIKLIDNGDGTYSYSNIPLGFNYRNIAGAATTTVKSGAGYLEAIIINKPIASGVITIYDNTSGSGTKIATLTNPLTLLQQQVQLKYGAIFSTGLTIVTSAADDITVMYR